MNNTLTKQIDTNNNITVKVCGKLILFGEHLVFYNSSVLGIPLPLYLEATFCYEDAQKQKNNKASKFYLISDYQIDPHFVELIYKVCTQNNISIPNSTVYIKSTIPIGSGYGSSAALCVALARGILHYNKYCKKLVNINTCTQQTEISNQDIWYFAHSLEQFFHNPSSGIDTALCTYEQALLLHPYTVSNITQKYDNLQKHSIKEKIYEIPKFNIHLLNFVSPRNHCLYIVSAVVQRERPTKEIIAYVKEQLQNSSKIQILQQLHNTALDQLILYYTFHSTETLRDIFNYRLFANTVESLQQQLYNLGLCTLSMQKAMNIAMKSGSIATKLSGAGGRRSFCMFL